FDPYHRWLGIPPKHQPADHYRLLAIERFEEDPEVIADAAERQTAHVRRYALGPHQDISQRILNELAAAKVCLLNPDKKAEYDRKLRAQTAAQEQVVAARTPPAAEPLPPVVVSAGTRSETSPGRDRPPGPVLVVGSPSRRPMAVSRTRLWKSGTQMSPVAVVGWAGSGGILLGVLIVLLWSWFWGGDSREVAESRRRDPTGGWATTTEPTLEAKPDAEPAKTEPLATPDTKSAEMAKTGEPTQPAEAPATPKKDISAAEEAKEPAQTEREKTEPEKAEPTAKQPSEKSAAGLPQELEDSIGIRFKLIPAGTFLMGSPDGDSDAWPGEKPQHLVRITKPFYLGVTEVTQEQYERVIGQNPSRFKGDPQRPVEMVSWEDAVAFCRKLSEQEGQTYRLPTEAEWEYACRARSQTKWSFGDDPAGLTEQAWFDRNSEGTTHPVAQKKPNAFGLYDVQGSVWEWCSDRYGEKYYGESPQADPQGPAEGSLRVNRGGSWDYLASDCRASCRGWNVSGYRYDFLGFRLVRESPASFP
ncbi:MAG: SUMF1/EgtB/PvdO family nonheme iron enzyme, partial [Rhodopirellula sp.]|nr:SUMF1/EgtB/PvdO family nonheme iron enzyme [Rhodopirellula sp.]